MKNRVRDICFDAMLLALLIICSQLSINTGIVKFTLQLLCVFIIGNTRSLKHSMIIIASYIILGLIGLPVFASFQGGLAYIYSPTFGFIYGFIILLIIQNILNYLFTKCIKNKYLSYSISSLIGLFVLYGCGLLHGYLILNIYKGASYSFNKLLSLFIVPYLPWDLLKLILATIISVEINKYIDHFHHQIHFDSLDSTSTYLKNNYSMLDNLTFVDASFQTNGKGRETRVWESSKDLNLMFSILIKDEYLINNFSYLSILSALMVKEALDQLRIDNVTIKWPNDVYIKDKKVCGILLESQSNNNGQIECLVIGIGINVNETQFNDDLKNKATSIKLELGKDINIKKIRHIIYRKMRKILSKQCNYSSLMERAQQCSYLDGKEVFADIKGIKSSVIVKGINLDGSITVIKDNKEIHLNTGEITFHK